VQAHPVTFGDFGVHSSSTNPPSDLADLLIDAELMGTWGSEMSIYILFYTDRIPSRIVEQMANLLSSYIALVADDINTTPPLASEHDFNLHRSLPWKSHIKDGYDKASIVISSQEQNNDLSSINSAVRKVWGRAPAMDS
jgi:hypothetical protein